MNEQSPGQAVPVAGHPSTNTDSVFSTRVRKAAWISVGLLVPLAVAFRTIASPDFWMRLATGRYIAAEGLPRTDVFLQGGGETAWVNPSWLYDRSLYALWQIGGAPLIVTVHAALLIAAFILMARRARRWATPAACVLALALSAWALFPFYRVGPSLPGLLFASIFLFVLANGIRPRRHLPVLLPLQILWANVSSSFLLGPVIVGLVAFESGLNRRRRPSRRPGIKGFHLSSAALPVAVLLLATLVNPFFFSAHQSALRLLFHSTPTLELGLIPPLNPWFPRALFHYAFLGTLFLLALGIIVKKGRLPLACSLLAFATAFFAFQDMETIPYFAVLGMPFLAVSIQALTDTLSDVFFRSRRPPGAAAFCMAGSTGFAILSALLISSGWADRTAGRLSRFGWKAERASFPSGAAEYISQHAMDGPLFNLPFDGGYLCWSLPNPSIYMDSRKELYSPERAEMIRRLLNGNAQALTELHQTLNPHWMVISSLWPGGPGLIRMGMESPAWVLTYFDGVTAVLIRPSDNPKSERPAAETVQASMAVLETDIREAQKRVRQGKRPPFSPRLVGAAFLFSALGQDQKVLELAALIEPSVPRMTYLSLLRGISLFRLGQPEEAALFLESFTRRSPQNQQGWFWLSQTYKALGKETEAREAHERSQ